MLRELGAYFLKKLQTLQSPPSAKSAAAAYGSP
jgi:hypothetical protein